MTGEQGPGGHNFEPSRLTPAEAQAYINNAAFYMLRRLELRGTPEAATFKMHLDDARTQARNNSTYSVELVTQALDALRAGERSLSRQAQLKRLVYFGNALGQIAMAQVHYMVGAPNSQALHRAEAILGEQVVPEPASEALRTFITELQQPPEEAR